jgi:hypothetical protein
MSLTYHYELTVCYKNMGPTTRVALKGTNLLIMKGYFKSMSWINTAQTNIFPQKPVIKMCPLVINHLQFPEPV